MNPGAVSWRRLSTILARALLVVFFLLLLAEARRPLAAAPPHRRFYGTLHAVSDLVWARAATRIAVPSWVTGREAEEHFRMLKVAARLNPENREIYRIGSFGLAFWHRPDLALVLVKEGITRFPEDSELKRQLFQVISLFKARPEDSLSTLDEMLAPVLERLSTGRMTRADASREFGPMLPFLIIMKAQQEEKLGRIADAIATWRLQERIFKDDLSFGLRAQKEIRRLQGD